MDMPAYKLFRKGGKKADYSALLKEAQKADVILYDNLACKELLDLAGDHCEKIYVGKKPYGAYTTQDTIHRLIKHYAFSRGNVLRLKGGDPFIFGRGFEEVIFAREQGIETEYIPGISSMQASGFSDIPLTHRGISESVWAITGTKKDGSLSSDLQLAIKSKATVVIYMGMKKLMEIATAYITSGKGDMPAAIIQDGSLCKQQHLRCKVKDLPHASFTAGLSNPAIIIIGNVVKVSEHINANSLNMMNILPIGKSSNS
ncbi:MAG: uroporphyrinogen-III C-methyltransferase [Pedobacter sp.]|nr:MAG: uroporphyrinogen-III C-methyltransferase [Pedobacter sp.]